MQGSFGQCIDFNLFFRTWAFCTFMRVNAFRLCERLQFSYAYNGDKACWKRILRTNMCRWWHIVSSQFDWLLVDQQPKPKCRAVASVTMEWCDWVFLFVLFTLQRLKIFHVSGNDYTIHTTVHFFLIEARMCSHHIFCHSFSLAFYLLRVCVFFVYGSWFWSRTVGGHGGHWRSLGLMEFSCRLLRLRVSSC